MRRIYRRVFFLFSSISFLFFSFKVRNRGFFLLQQQSFAVYRVFFLLLYRVFFFTSISPPLPLISHDPKQPVRLLLEDDVVCVFVSLLGLFVSASRLVPETSVSSRSSHPNRIIWFLKNARFDRVFPVFFLLLAIAPFPIWWFRSTSIGHRIDRIVSKCGLGNFGFNPFRLWRRSRSSSTFCVPVTLLCAIMSTILNADWRMLAASFHNFVHRPQRWLEDACRIIS